MSKYECPSCGRIFVNPKWVNCMGCGEFIHEYEEPKEITIQKITEPDCMGCRQRNEQIEHMEKEFRVKYFIGLGCVLLGSMLGNFILLCYI